MSYENVECVAEGCEVTIKNNRWAKTKAEGWFFSKEIPADKGYCPEHVPEWVEAWRAKKKTARPEQGTVEFSARCTSCKEPVTKKPGEANVWSHDGTGKIECGAVAE